MGAFCRTKALGCSMLRVILALALLGCALAWQNNWDRPHNFQCSGGQYIYRIRSYHHNHYEDRRWLAYCTRVSGIKADRSCAWTGWVNSWDGILSYTCPWCYTTDKKTRWEECRISSCACPRGTYGENCEKECHCQNGASCTSPGRCSNGCAYGWAGKDCQAKIDAAPTQCVMSSYANNWDATMDFNVGPNGYAIAGAFSFHDNGREDRRWKFMYRRVNDRV